MAALELTAAVVLPCGDEATVKMPWPGGRSFHRETKYRSCRVGHAPRKFRLGVEATWQGTRHQYMAISRVWHLDPEPHAVLALVEAGWFDATGGPYEPGADEPDQFPPTSACTKGEDCPVEPKGSHVLDCPIGQRALAAAPEDGRSFAPGWEAQVYTEGVRSAIEDLAQRYSRLGADLHTIADSLPPDLDTLGIDFAGMGDDALQAIRSAQGNAVLGRLLKTIVAAENAQQEDPATFRTYRERSAR